MRPGEQRFQRVCQANSGAPGSVAGAGIGLARATEEEKRSQVERTRRFREKHREEAQKALPRLGNAAAGGENVFDVLMGAARVGALGQITEAFFEVGGQYRRNV